MNLNTFEIDMTKDRDVIFITEPGLYNIKLGGKKSSKKSSKKLGQSNYIYQNKKGFMTKYLYLWLPEP